jgi:hypothetical protein
MNDHNGGTGGKHRNNVGGGGLVDHHPMSIIIRFSRSCTCRKFRKEQPPYRLPDSERPKPAQVHLSGIKSSQRTQSEQLLLRRVLNDDVVRISQIQHGAGAFIERVQVKVAGTQSRDAALPGIMICLDSCLIGLCLVQQVLALGIGHQSTITLRGAPGEVTGDSEENRWQDCRASAPFKFPGICHANTPNPRLSYMRLRKA